MKIAVIGAGSWGTALAIKSRLAGNETFLYHREKDRAHIMQVTRKNPEYLKNVTLPEGLQVISDYETVLKEATVVLIVTPSQYVRDTLEALAEYITPDMHIVGCSKGLERSTGKRMSQVMKEVLGHKTEHFAILSGPNHAEEVAINLPSATVIGCPDEMSGSLIRDALASDTFRVYTNTDMIGVELCGTTKNIVALAAGLVHGMHLGDNCVSALLTRGLHEMTSFGLLYGAKRETYAGLAGMGDLIATCMSKNSRNRSAGIQLAQGLTMDEIVQSTNMVVEGFVAVLSVYEEAKKKQIEMPITEALHDVLLGNLSPKMALENLMTREPKNETQIVKKI